MSDMFRPRAEPAAQIYDALMDEVRHRRERELDEWIMKERERVWSTARDYAQKHGLRVPLMSDVEEEERNAQGHCDYASKWAIGVHLLLLKKTA